MRSDHCQKLIVSIREQCLSRGIGGIKGLCVLFRGMDTDYSKTLSFGEFARGLRAYKLEVSEDHLKELFAYLDKDSSGCVDFREFLQELRPPMKQCRVDVINEAFDKMDVIKDDRLKVDDLKIVYRTHAEKHPNFISGKWTMDQTLQNFLDTFDSPDDRDGQVTREEFLNYYAGVGATVEADDYFDLMMRSCWGLPPKGANRK